MQQVCSFFDSFYCFVSQSTHSFKEKLLPRLTCHSCHCSVTFHLCFYADNYPSRGTLELWWNYIILYDYHSLISEVAPSQGIKIN